MLRVVVVVVVVVVLKALVSAGTRIGSLAPVFVVAGRRTDLNLSLLLFHRDSIRRAQLLLPNLCGWIASARCRLGRSSNDAGGLMRPPFGVAVMIQRDAAPGSERSVPTTGGNGV